MRQHIVYSGAAVAEFYPDVTLMSTFGLQRLQLKVAFSLPSRELQVGPSVCIPLFKGGRLRSALRVRRAQQCEATISFRRTPAPPGPRYVTKGRALGTHSSLRPDKVVLTPRKQSGATQNDSRPGPGFAFRFAATWRGGY